MPDQYSTVQAALDALSPGDTYTLTADAEVSQTLRPSVDGTKFNLGGYTLKPTSGAGDNVNPLIDLDNKAGVIVFNGTVDGGASWLTQSSGHAAISLSQSSHCTLEDISTQNCGRTSASPAGAHIVVSEGSHHNRIVRVDCSDTGLICQYGIQMYTPWLTSNSLATSHNEILNCTTDGFMFNAISLEGPLVQHNRVYGCEVRNHRGNTSIECDKGASYNVIESCLVDGMDDDVGGLKSAGYRIQGWTNGTTTYWARGNTVRNCRVTNVATPDAGSFGILVATYVEGAYIRDCPEVNVGSNLHAIGIRDNVKDLHVTGNFLLGKRGIWNDKATTAVRDVFLLQNRIDADIGIVLDEADGDFDGLIVAQNIVRYSLGSAGISVGAGITHQSVTDNVEI